MGCSTKIKTFIRGTVGLIPRKQAIKVTCSCDAATELAVVAIKTTVVCLLGYLVIYFIYNRGDINAIYRLFQ